MMKFLLTALFLLAAGSAQAERFSNLDGSKLLGLCTGRDKGVVGDCTAYIEGISDTASFYQRLRPADGSKGGKLPVYLCISTGVTGVQMREAVVSWAKAHPDSMKLQASGVVLRALHDNYKCAGSEGGLGS